VQGQGRPLCGRVHPAQGRQGRQDRRQEVTNRSGARQKRHERIRLSLSGTSERPRLAVFRSLNHIYAQVIDDGSGKTMAAASTVEKELKGSSSTKTEEAAVVGRLLAE